MKSKKVYIAVACMLLWAVLCVPDYRDVALYVFNRTSDHVVVIDPGHGGIDGGAESSDGTCEKDINLAIAMDLKKLLEAENIKVIMTRKTDAGLYDGSQDSAIRTLKTQDMNERKRIIDDSGADLTVSIHLNSFTQDSSVKGAQVFFPSDGSREMVGESELAAKSIQQSLNDGINKAKKRTELGKNDVFLLRNVTAPIVIVECGFLSNPDDAAHLKNPDYQGKISEILKDGICKYLAEKTAADR